MIDGRKRTTEQKHLIRRIAAQRYLEGESPKRIAVSLGVSIVSVHRWANAAKDNGLDALAPKPPPGRPRKLTPEEELMVYDWVTGGDPRQLGLDFGLWTRAIIRDQIAERIGVIMSITSVGEMLHRLGLTPQKPLRRAYERNEVDVQSWVNNTYPKIKKCAKRKGAEIFWLDEAGIRSDDPLQRTWGIKGRTPIVETSSQRQSLNIITALSNSGGFWYHAYSGRFNADTFIHCLKRLLRGRRKPLIVILDGHPVHKSKKVNEFIENVKDRLQIEFLPPYAPDRNPDEYVFHYLKKKGSTKKPLKKGESLKNRTLNDLEAIKKDKNLVKSFFRAELVTFAAA